jgi:hypothetical protein
VAGFSTHGPGIYGQSTALDFPFGVGVSGSSDKLAAATLAVDSAPGTIYRTTFRLCEKTERGCPLLKRFCVV